ncbi:MAG: aldehyde dehydrogenase (NADP(+)) [Verrucomicrobiota bacterium]|nr:aldehyde dehydrogenase (NADP(+)) [Limisphaera sp.]MDW8382783.1 aldehyde dehydrogenase (NADP(+)) [Verrucomicrobiota bacterium]
MKLEGLSIIGRGRARRVGPATAPVSPITGARLSPEYHWATLEDVDRAAQLAWEAFLMFRQWPAARRAALLRRIADLIEAAGPMIQQRAHEETALPLPRLQAETARTCHQLRLFATTIEAGWWLDARIDHGDPNRTPVPRPDVRSFYVPLGPVAVFSSSNFPLAFSVAGGDTASALAAGCPVLVKPHQGHMGTSEMVGLLVQQAAEECGAPEGLFSLLYGPGREIGIALVRHPLVKAVGFTGSRTGGRSLMEAAASRPDPIPVYAEMGSVNPVFLLPGALQERAEGIATGLHGSVTLGVGQFCTCPGLVFVESGPATDRFLKKLVTLMQETPPGVMLTADLCAAYREGVQKFARVPGVKLLTSETPLVDPIGTRACAALLQTEATVFLQHETLMEEIFGPATLVVCCQGRGDMMAIASRLEGQLTATIHATVEELVQARDLVALLETKAGRLVFNGFPTGVEVCHAMVHGGPWPATSDGRSTSVGTRAILRFVRPLCYQNFPEVALPEALQESNPLGLRRLVDGRWE